MYSFAAQFNNMTVIPSVISMSYTWAEIEQCRWDPTNCADYNSYIVRVNSEFQKLGARGVTLLASAGDGGAHGTSDDDCGDKVVRPSFPGSSPYVTSVGGTMIQAGTGVFGGKSPLCTSVIPGQCVLNGTQIVLTSANGALVTSGGGFSNVAARPSYQDNAVKPYVANPKNTPAAGNFNASGRGYPDVAALGHQCFIEGGGPTLVDGTACGVPVWGGVISLLNAYLVGAGKTSVGFANPALYTIAAANSGAFVDITVGDNTCTTDTCNCSPGFQATTGWDAVTGLGTPVYPQLLAGFKTLHNLN